jgi:glutathionylspermidine synthase
LPHASTRWLEAPWKMLLSNKALLPLLWHLFPESPYLLRAAHLPWGGDHVAKPLLSREGSNVSIMQNGEVTASTDGPYRGRVVYQQYVELKEFGGYFPIIGSWMVNGHAAGMGIREDKTRITGNLSRFIPHAFWNESA